MEIAGRSGESMNRKKRILAIVCALIALAAIAAAIHVILRKNSAPEEGYRSMVQPPSEAAPDWTRKGQEPRPDYSALELAPRNATTVPDEKTMEAPNATSPAPTVIEEDDFVTFAFIESLAQYTAERFTPGRDGKQPSTSATFRSLNMYYGRNFDGLSVGSEELRQNRDQIFDYVFSPVAIKSLYSLYAGLFVDQLEESVGLAFEEKGEQLTRAELSDMFRLNAVQLIRTASIFTTIAETPALSALTARYIQAARAVERANARFQDSLSASAAKKDEAGKGLKHAIRERERIRSSIVANVRKKCTDCPDADMFYIAMWSYRRTLGNTEKLKTFAVAGECLQDLADRFREKSAELLEPQT